VQLTFSKSISLQITLQAALGLSIGNGGRGLRRVDYLASFAYLSRPLRLSGSKQPFSRLAQAHSCRINTWRICWKLSKLT